MSEPDGRRPRFGRRRRPAPSEPVAEVPCVPCAQKAGVRPFTLDPTPVAAIDAAFVPVLTDRFEFAMLDGEVVLFDAARATSTLLNRAAAMVWASVDDRTPVGTIVAELVAETGAPSDVIDHDVREALARFADSGIIVAPTPVADQPPRAPVPDGASRARAARRAERIERVLEGIEWCAGPGTRSCAGVAVAVRTNDPDLADRLNVALADLPGAVEPVATISVVAGRRPDSPRRFRVLLDTELRAWAPNERVAIDAVLGDLDDVAAGHRSDRLVLHAGAVARDGAVVVIAGASGRGKSTLTAALVQRGFAYLTDEVVALDPATWTVLPYPKPLDLGRAALELLGLDPEAAPASSRRKAKVPVGQLGRAATGSGPVRLLVLLGDPTGDPDRPGPAPTAAETLAAILTNTFASTFDAGSDLMSPLAELARMASELPILHLGRVDLDQACGTVEARLAEIVGGS